MPTTIKHDGEFAIEESSYLITLEFFDETGQDVVPKTGAWTLTDLDGAVINGRDAVAIGSLDSTIYILLTGDDLALSAGFTGRFERRLFLFEGTYDSMFGNDNPLKDQLNFPIKNLAHITA